MKEVNYAQAGWEALQEEFRRDNRFIYMGTARPGALAKEFGEERVRGTPLSESAFVGAAIGLAGSGFRAVANLGAATFAYVAMDQLINQAAKITYMFGGQTKFPIVYLMASGGRPSAAAQHVTNNYSMFMNAPGLKIILPATPYDNKGLLKTALRDNNPVMYFQHSQLGDVKGEIPEDDYTVPFGKAAIRKNGKDVTVVGLAKMMYEALAAADTAEKKGISVEVIDPRTLVPLDVHTIRKSVIKTGRLVVVDEACPTCSAASEIVAQVVLDKKTFSYLKSSPKMVTARNIPTPFSPSMEKYAVANRRQIADAVQEVMDYTSLKYR